MSVTISKTRKALQSVINPSTQKSIGEDGTVRNITIEEGKVAFDLLFADSTMSGADVLKQKAEEAVKSIDGVTDVIVKVIKAQKPQSAQAGSPKSMLDGVKNIIAISSAKGGVGKSTMTAHIARQLTMAGMKVAIMDADIFGPSIPTLFQCKNAKVVAKENNILVPVECQGLKIMSFGFLLGDRPAVMRGPVVTRYIQQILLGTEWGDLDYLLIDMPPGTGDIQLTITQTIRLSGAVIVTTPHTLSLIDVARGIIMFEKVEVPIVGIIENMSYLQTGTDEKQYIFGTSQADSLAQRFGVSLLGEIPILQSLSQSVAEGKSESVIDKTVVKMQEQLESIKSDTRELPKISFDAQNVMLQWPKGETWRVRNFDLRMISQDALSVDELSGKRLITEKDIRSDIAAKEIVPLGHYGINIAWNDGHSSAIYTYKNIREIAEITDD